MSSLRFTVEATLTKTGNDLVGVIASSRRAGTAPKPVPHREWEHTLTVHAQNMTAGDTVDVTVTVDRATGQRTVALAGTAPLADITTDTDRGSALSGGGFVNPYTFVPTLPRAGLEATGLGDGPPPSHARHAAGQWSGTLTVQLTTVTPLLLPTPTPTTGDTKEYETRTDTGGLPMIHGASLKGALRSAYETITASRYGVFFEHHDRLAYRAPASATLIPAQVRDNSDGTRSFRLCRGDRTWKDSQTGNHVQDAAWVPAYKHQQVQRLGDLAAGPLTRHHGRSVYARVVLYQYERISNGRPTRFRVWRATHLASTEAEIIRSLAVAPAPGPQRAGKLARIDAVEPRIVQGWLSATGRSIDSKHDERLFVETPGADIPLTEQHVDYWRAILRAYDVAAGYNDPKATYRHEPAGADGIERSRHVPSTPPLRELPAGTLVYVKYDQASKTISQVHPVMIGRLPFAKPPGELLPESLRPTADRGRLSPADRLFGWVPAGRRDDGQDTNDGASGYRGRLRIEHITCTSTDWRPQHSFPADGVTLAPLSSPKPTQFRFYATPDTATGRPIDRRAAKETGYTEPGGPRGRKMYRWREEPSEHWQPTADREDPQRGYLALQGHRAHPKQLVKHRDWVRPGVTFTATLHLDGVPEPELGALLWLLTRGAAAPLRLGAGKPYGFGVLTVSLDTAATRLWDADGVRAGWLQLTRPDPANTERITALADRFDTTARANPVLREATVSYLTAAAPVTDAVHYPRSTAEPEPENYQWFVANERPRNGTITHGWALPHVRDPEQRLPYLPEEPRPTSNTARPRRPGPAPPGGDHRRRSR
ncbi:TIGR03986 family CRISPR-associated RAMP protein [Dactylosporangium sp. NPDC005555]|uniref:TIGR03986 family type III CRISPR-associated RAMP protein n=1 Tax=Dactylosporangium sp. NPDC005555 TaxID=3154889 RepID=UPI0033A238B1